jgi:membrane-bound serine protease (ClpP class)
LEVVLFIAGIVFILVELFVIPGFGFAGITGVLLLIVSFILAGQDFIVPVSKSQTDQFVMTLLTLMGSGFVFMIAAFFVTKRMGSMPFLNRLVLDTPQIPVEDSKEGNSKNVFETHPEISIGDWGVSESVLRPAGRAIFSGRSFDVVSDGAYVESGQQVKVIRIQGNIVTVAKIHE